VIEIGGGSERRRLLAAVAAAAVILLAVVLRMRGRAMASVVEAEEGSIVIISNCRWLYRYRHEEEWRPALVREEGGLYVNVIPPPPPGDADAEVRPAVDMCCPLYNVGFLELKAGARVRAMVERRGSCYVLREWEKI